VISVPIRIIAGLLFATPLSSRLMPISLTGRKAGKPCRRPVS